MYDHVGDLLVCQECGGTTEYRRALKHKRGCSIVAGIQGLGRREREVVLLLSTGKNTKQIAADLNLSDKTVRTHKDNAMRKLGVHNLATLVRLVVDYERDHPPEKGT